MTHEILMASTLCPSCVGFTDGSGFHHAWNCPTQYTNTAKILNEHLSISANEYIAELKVQCDTLQRKLDEVISLLSEASKVLEIYNKKVWNETNLAGKMKEKIKEALAKLEEK